MFQIVILSLQAARVLEVSQELFDERFVLSKAAIACIQSGKNLCTIGAIANLSLFVWRQKDRMIKSHVTYLHFET